MENLLFAFNLLDSFLDEQKGQTGMSVLLQLNFPAAVAIAFCQFMNARAFFVVRDGAPEHLAQALQALGG